MPALARLVQTDPELRRADVLMLQEIDVYPGRDAPRDLAERLGMSVFYAPARRTARGSHGIAVLSRHPISDPETIVLPSFHLVYRSRPRVALEVKVTTDASELHLFNVHLDTRILPSQRAGQLAPVLERARARPRAVIGGDVNTIHAIPVLLPLLPLPFVGFGQAEHLDALVRQFGFETPLASIGRTGPLGMRLDAMFTRGVAVLRAGKSSAKGLSDHRPLWVEVVPLGTPSAPAQGREWEAPP